MTARIILVHDDHVFAEDVCRALHCAGYDVVVFAHPLEALAAIEQSDPANILITRVQFPVGMPHGIALAQMVRMKRPAMKILITGKPQFAEHAHDIGTFLAHPVHSDQVVAAVYGLLNGEGSPTATSIKLDQLGV